MQSGHTAAQLAKAKGCMAIVQTIQKYELRTYRKKQAHYDSVERKA
jgi:hypothetical protein